VEAGRLSRGGLFDLLAEDVEWSALGPFPWSGTHRGHDGVRRWLDLLNEAMDYDRFVLRELYQDGETVVEVIDAAGTARRTGRPFASEVVRLWTFRDALAVRVRSYYDTYAYVQALGDVSARPATPD
jgi:ketosteroid isomerase-like protein